jgi:outer membrane protein assembly factor BamA
MAAWRGSVLIGCCAVLLGGGAGAFKPAHGEEALADSLQGTPIGRIWCSGNGRTTDHVILQELLLRSGDPYEPELIQESERNLRSRPYLGTAEIIPHTNPGQAVVDLEVAVTERWAWIIAALPSLGGGRLDMELILADLNFLGRGQIIGLQSFLSSEEENTLLFYFEEPRLIGSRWGGSILVGRQGELGDRFRLELERPLFALSTKWALHVSVFDESVQRQLYRDGLLTSDYYQRNRGGDVGVRRSFRRDNRRLEIGVSAGFQNEANESVTESSWEIPADKRRGSLLIRVSAERFRFVRDTYFLKMGPVEDLKLGPRGSVRLGGVAGFRGDDRRYPLVGAGFSWWGGSPHRLYATVASDVDVRVEDGEFTNIVAGASARLYNWVSKRGYLAWRAQAHFLGKMEDPSQLRLDSANGLRGYEAQALDGTRRILANLEWRQIVRAGRRLALGIVGFVDAGVIWSDSDSLREAPLHVGSGYGLRLGFPTVYGAPLLRLDLGYAVRRGTWEVSAGFDQRF